MSLVFGRLLARKRPVVTPQRTYSFFWSKSGNPRYFTSNKPPKVASTTQQQVQGATKSHPGSSTTSAAAGTNEPKRPELLASTDSEPAETKTPPAPEPLPAASSPERSHTSHSSSVLSPALPPTSFPQAAEDLEQLLSPSRDTVALHSFFSLHRPMMLLPVHPAPASLFSALSSSSSEPVEDDPTRMLGLNSKEPQVLMATGELISPGIPAQLKREQEESQRQQAAMEESEREAEAARWLTRSLFVHRVGGAMVWAEQLKAWGDAQANDVVRAVERMVRMDSTKRKRKRKMSKHKYVPAIYPLWEEMLTERSGSRSGERPRGQRGCALGSKPGCHGLERGGIRQPAYSLCASFFRQPAPYECSDFIEHLRAVFPIIPANCIITIRHCFMLTPAFFAHDVPKTRFPPSMACARYRKISNHIHQSISRPHPPHRVNVVDRFRVLSYLDMRILNSLLPPLNIRIVQLFSK